MKTFPEAMWLGQPVIFIASQPVRIYRTTAPARNPVLQKNGKIYKLVRNVGQETDVLRLMLMLRSQNIDVFK